MTTDETSRAGRRITGGARGRRALTTAALAATCVALTARPAAAQDPPPPLAPAEPDAPPPPAPAPPPSADTPPVAPPVALPPAATPPSAPPSAPATPFEPPGRAPGAHVESARVLRGLAFPTPSLVDSAFTQSHLGIGLELGRQWDYGVITAYPGTSASDHMFQFDRRVGVASQHLSFGLAVSERVELGFDAGYTAQLSTDVNSALQFGARSGWTLRPGVRLQLVRSQASGTQLALRLYGDFAGDHQQSPAAVLGEIAAEAGGIAGSAARTSCLGSGDLSCALANGRFDAAATASTSRILAGGGATLSLAQAFSSVFGLQAALGLEAGYRSTTAAASTVGSTPITFHVGVAPSLDFGPKVPLGLMVEDQLTVVGELSSDGDGTILRVQNVLAGGAYYTGRQDLSLGAVFSATFASLGVKYSDGSSVSGAPTLALTGQVTGRYFF